MKKLALLLGALSLVSSVAYAKEVVPAVEEVVVVEETAPIAAPALRVTSFGQGLEVDNTSGGTADIGEPVFLSTSVGLAYGDNWTFGLMARKGWNIDTDDGIHSAGHRIDIDAWRAFDNFSLGARWRQEENYDRFYLRGKYNYGMFSGDLDVAYTSTNGNKAEADGYYIEGTPLNVTVGPLKVGYYFKTENEIATGDSRNDGVEYWLRHQLRVSMPIYQGEKLNVGVQYGWEFANNIEYDDKYSGAYKHDTNSHILWLNASYKVTENLTIDGYYEYDMFEWELDGNEKKGIAGSQKNEDSSKYYGEFYIGWTYTF